MADYFTAVSKKNILWPSKKAHQTFFVFLSTQISNTNSRFQSVIGVNGEEQVYYLLQLSALFKVFVPKFLGLPLNTIRLRLWLLAFLIIAGMLFEACDKHSTTPPFSGIACAHSSTTTAVQACKTYTKPSLIRCCSHNMR